MNKLSFFMGMVQYNFLRFIPSKKQQFFEYLEEISESVPVDICNWDIILIYVAVYLFAGFQWTFIMFFLVLFINIAEYAAKGGHLC